MKLAMVLLLIKIMAIVTDSAGDNRNDINNYGHKVDDDYDGDDCNGGHHH